MMRITVLGYSSEEKERAARFGGRQGFEGVVQGSRGVGGNELGLNETRQRGRNGRGKTRRGEMADETRQSG
jgi:hypothetical protein